MVDALVGHGQWVGSVEGVGYGVVHFTKAGRRSSENISVAQKALDIKREIVRQNQSMGLVDLYLICIL